MKLITHKIFLFNLRNGKKKMAYGLDPAHAKQILGYRLKPEEMAEITDDEPTVITQRDLRQWIPHLG